MGKPNGTMKKILSDLNLKLASSATTNHKRSQYKTNKPRRFLDYERYYHKPR